MDNTEAEAKQPKGDQQQGDEEEGPPPGWQSIPPQASAPQQPLHLSSEMAQMVCGSCRQLLSYPRGTLLAKCSCCETVNFVLEGSDAPTQTYNWSLPRALIRLEWLSVTVVQCC
ncbi:protein LOL2 isoform X2 [Durio zibethinus]|uniref:Protein LOL2 isoform X2 n=1 Tax=Durio zibethinus TaxID=66656 RepID=A0A6P6BJQ0_DURZI|nr:protein LOL2 isoform X2 [Durio zibethinus]